jgi:hypothetical protein
VPAALVTLTCSDKLTEPLPEETHFAVHEWGVMIGCQSDSAFFLTSRPEIAWQVDVPVIYFHSDAKEPFSVRVRFRDGEPRATYPEAESGLDTLVWSNVTFPDSSVTRIGKATDDYVPLEQLIPILDDVDADLLQYNDIQTRFLFYEGESEFVNSVLVSYDRDSLLFLRRKTVWRRAKQPACHLPLLIALMWLRTWSRWVLPSLKRAPLPRFGAFLSASSLVPQAALISYIGCRSPSMTSYLNWKLILNPI